MIKKYIVQVENCNNIKLGKVEIEKGKLNVKYGINGTGKTSLSKAIEFHKDQNMLENLKTYNSEDGIKVILNENINKVLAFNEKFVTDVVFKESEVIEKSFEVFIKTPKYDEKKQLIDIKLSKLKQILKNDVNLKLI